MKKSKRRILIPERLFRNLPKNLKSKVNSYRGVLSNIVKQENKIAELQDEIQKCKNKIERYSETLTDKNIEIDNLRDDFDFTCSICKTNPKGFEYYILTISRRTKSPKNIYMGSEKKIKKHLLVYYKKDKDKLYDSCNWHLAIINFKKCFLETKLYFI